MFQRNGRLITAAKQQRKQENIILSSMKILAIFLTHSHCHRICWWSFNVSRVKKERHEDITFFYKKTHYTAMHVRPEVTPTTVFKALFNYLSGNFRLGSNIIRQRLSGKERLC